MKLTISTVDLTRKECADLVMDVIELVSVVEENNYDKTISVQGNSQQLIKAMKVFNSFPHLTL